MSIVITTDLEKVINKLQDFICCFQITMQDGAELYLNNSDTIIQDNDIVYVPYSGLSLKEAEFNDSAQNYIILEGIFENAGITYDMNLTGAGVKIILYTNNVFQHYITYYCSIYTRYDLSFEIYLKPETVKYNQTIINRFSKTCKANFGDDKCMVDKNQYSVLYKVHEVLQKNLE